MSSDTDAWAELQALKLKRDSRRRKLEERKKERNDKLASTIYTGSSITHGAAVGDTSSNPVDDNLDAASQLKGTLTFSRKRKGKYKTQLKIIVVVL